MVCTRAFQERVSRGAFLHERHPQWPGKGAPVHHLYECKQCGKAFNRKWYLVRRQRIHTGTKPYECDACGQAFSQSCTLIRHHLSHSEEKPAVRACGKAFGRRSRLTQHQPLHAGERPYACSQCRKAFSHRSTFPRHRPTHSGEKPFECKECEESFGSRAHLAQHSAVHTGQKPRACAQCPQAFRWARGCGGRRVFYHLRWCREEEPRNYHLEKTFCVRSPTTCHTRATSEPQRQRAHSGERPYACRRSGKACRRRALLRQRAAVHSAQPPVRCSLGSPAFKRRSHLRQHPQAHAREGSLRPRLALGLRVTGRKARGLQVEEGGCRCRTFLSLSSGRKKQISDVFSSLYKFKRRFLSPCCVARTPGLT